LITRLKWKVDLELVGEVDEVRKKGMDGVPGWTKVYVFTPSSWRRKLSGLVDWESSEEMFEVGEGVGSRVRIDQVEMGGGLSR
jgi:hypothetical protein